MIRAPSRREEPMDISLTLNFESSKLSSSIANLT
jgi:hypothetical protein